MVGITEGLSVYYLEHQSGEKIINEIGLYHLMLSGNPLIAELQLMFKTMKGMKEDLLALQDKSIFQDEQRSRKLQLHLEFLFSHFKHYSKKELEWCDRDELSKSCKALLEEIGTHYLFDLKNMFSPRQRIPKNFPFEKIRELIQKIEEAEKTILKAEDEVIFELRQKRKARRLARSQLNLRELGCYHYTSIGRLLHILRNGLVSVEYAQREMEQELEIALENYQGRKYLSVFDPYSYWRLYRYFLAKGILNKIIKEGTITEDDLRGAFKANKELNLSKFGEINIGIFKNEGIFHEPDNEYLGPFKLSMIECTPHSFVPYSSDRFSAPGEIVLVINDTMQFFPKHQNAYEFEGLFEDKVVSDKIVGIALREEYKHYAPLIQELAKLVGLPLYDSSGKLIWPTR